MTISRMRRLMASVLVVPLLAACGDQETIDPAAAERMEQAQEEAESAMAAVRSLRERVAELETDLEAAEGSASEARSKLDEVAERLWASLRKVRSSIGEAEASASDAAGAASAALVEAEAAAKDLSVLQERFDYHLSQSGGR